MGIGASAGGLDALERFLRHVPSESGLAFVVIQHLDPAAKDFLPQLLQPSTPMPVRRARDGMRVAPDRVYVIPPGWDLTLEGEALRLLPRSESRGRHLPVDRFMVSLAQARGSQAIGVLLSGMGSDGVEGLAAIKDRGGLGVVQDPADAQFDSMPRSALEAGLVDRVGPAQDLARLILAHLRPLPKEPGPAAPGPAAPGPAAAGPDLDALVRILYMVRQHTGQDFNLYKPRTLLTRIRRRLELFRLPSLQIYAAYLEHNPEEAGLLAKELLIGVTRFFRDPGVWQALATEVLPMMLRARPAGKEFRAWTAGCSTGEEAYSLAIAFHEAMDRMEPVPDCTLRLFATDLDPDAVALARKGLFPARIAEDVEPECLAAYFTPEAEGYRVAKGIRDRVVFASHNLVRDPPFRHLDLLCCRNLLIYLKPEAQRQLLRVFHQCLEPAGVLVLGNAEGTGSQHQLFEPLDGRNRIYLRGPDGVGRDLAMPPACQGFREPRGTALMEARPNLVALAERVLLGRFASPAVLVNDAGDVFYQHGETGPYLEPPAGRTNWNLFAMARGPLLAVLAPTLLQADQENGPVRCALAREPDCPPVDLVVQHLGPDTGLPGLTLVAFQAGEAQAQTALAQGTGARRTLQRELRGLRVSAQADHRRMQAAQQEATTIREQSQSTLEELQSANEELSVANEALLVSNEELRLVNEELSLSRAGVQALLDEQRTTQARQQIQLRTLERAGWEQEAFLDATAALLVGMDLRVRRCTPRAAALYHLLPDDLGRPLTDLAGVLDYPDLVADARRVLANLCPLERTVASRDGRWFTVRMKAHVSREHRIDGLVLLLEDTTRTIRLGRSLQAGEGRLGPLLDLLPGACALGSLLPDPRGGPGDGRGWPGPTCASPACSPRSRRASEGQTFLEALPALAPLWPKVAAWAQGWPDAGLPGTPLRLDGTGFLVDVQPLAGSEVIFIFQGTPDPGADRA